MGSIPILNTRKVPSSKPLSMEAKADYPPKPILLSGEHVELIPIALEFLEPLCEAVQDGELWRLWYTFIPTPATMKVWIEKALNEKKEGVSLPFVVKRKIDRRIVGSTRYMNIDKDIRRLEIGTTWYSKSVQRSYVNTECKYLLLRHAFEELACRAVEFRTHRLNEQSRRAIERLGAQLDGMLRNHRMMANGTIRDTAVYSILDTEWEGVKSNLLFRLTEKVYQ
jgi:RimJ/RimL family protein N-acetyltransferase